MGKPPQRPKVQLPSPLQQVHFTRPLSQPPQEMGLVRDPAFWKRFSVAVHQADGDIEHGSTNSSVGEKDQWLNQQRKEKRRCRVLCVVITMIVIIVIVAAAVCGWYFTKAVK